MIYEYTEFRSEQQLFDFIKKFFIEDLESSENPTSRYDCYSPKFKSHIELKCRRKHYQHLIIEKSKYDAMMKRCEKDNTIPIYINSTPEGVWGFYLTGLNLEWEERSLPKQTDFSKKHHVKKIVSYLDVDKGKDLLSLLSLLPPTLG